MTILAIDPGDKQSAYCFIDSEDLRPLRFGKEQNAVVLLILQLEKYDLVVIERLASYGMPVGRNVFETCEWVGRFTQAAQKSGIFRSHAIRRRNCKMNKCSLFDMTFSEIIEDIFGVSFDRLWELALADRERRCVVMPCQPGYKISYKSSIGFWCNAVIKDYTPENIFITAETEIPNAEPLSHTFSILEVEIALQRDKE